MMAAKRDWVLSVEQSGGEYTGEISILAEDVQIDKLGRGFIADGVEVYLNENVISLKEELPWLLRN